MWLYIPEVSHMYSRNDKGMPGNRWVKGKEGDPTRACTDYLRGRILADSDFAKVAVRRASGRRNSHSYPPEGDRVFCPAFDGTG